MSLLLLKLTVTPVLIGAATVAGRRWGAALSGWLVGLPLTSAPVTFFLALNHGSSFAAATAVGILAGTVSQAAFAVVYGRLASHAAWPLALTAGCLVFGGATASLHAAQPGLPASLVAALISLVAGTLLLPHEPGAVPAGGAPPAWDLPLRMVVATAIVVLLTSIAPALGPRLTGLLTPFPVYATVLAVFAHGAGGQAAVGVLRGLLLGLFGFVACFVLLALLLPSLGLLAFAPALGAALAVQGATLRMINRGDRP